MNKEYNREPFEEDNYVIISSSRKDDIHRQGVDHIKKRIWIDELQPNIRENTQH